jgi:RNA polymerase-binding transcription factor DksA
MRDMKTHLERLRAQTVEFEEIRDSATDDKKRQLFARLAEHFRMLAAEIERAMK